ncbi:MAG: HEPN domain-containing protein [Clostridiales bacterium]|jgi:HEPN domain-containing protein|nr:HEPN domain-containing protein [Clostridiales bacterium]
MSDLLRIAAADLAGAKYYASHETDEVYLNLAGYHCAQAAEKILKAFIISKGVVPPKIHKTYELINFAKNRGMFENVLMPVEKIVVELDAWTSETRYVVNHLASKDRILFSIAVLEDLIEHLLPRETDSIARLKAEVQQNPPGQSKN